MVCCESEEEFIDGCENGRFSGRLGKGDDDRWWFYLGD